MSTGLLAFRSMMRDLPDVEAVLMDPDGSPVPEDKDAQFFICCALVQRMENSNFGACMRYLGRMSQIMRVFTFKSAFQTENLRKRDGLLPQDWVPLGSSPDFIAWAQTEEGKLVSSVGGS